MLVVPVVPAAHKQADCPLPVAHTQADPVLQNTSVALAVGDKRTGQAPAVDTDRNQQVEVLAVGSERIQRVEAKAPAVDNVDIDRDHDNTLFPLEKESLLALGLPQAVDTDQRVEWEAPAAVRAPAAVPPSAKFHQATADKFDRQHPVTELAVGIEAAVGIDRPRVPPAKFHRAVADTSDRQNLGTEVAVGIDRLRAPPARVHLRPAPGLALPRLSWRLLGCCLPFLDPGRGVPVQQSPSPVFVQAWPPPMAMDAHRQQQ